MRWHYTITELVHVDNFLVFKWAPSDLGWWSSQLFHPVRGLGIKPPSSADCHVVPFQVWVNQQTLSCHDSLYSIDWILWISLKLAGTCTHGCIQRMFPSHAYACPHTCPHASARCRLCACAESVNHFPHSKNRDFAHAQKNLNINKNNFIHLSEFLSAAFHF